MNLRRWKLPLPLGKFWVAGRKKTWWSGARLDIWREAERISISVYPWYKQAGQKLNRPPIIIEMGLDDTRDLIAKLEAACGVEFTGNASEK